MAYQVKRTGKIEESLELLDENGTVAEVIHVSFGADAMAQKVMGHYTDLLRVYSRFSEMKKGKEIPEELLGEFNETAMTLFRSVFGDVDAERILRFYDGNHVEMCTKVTPFIYEVVIPNLRKAVQERRNSALKPYKRKKGFFR